MVFPVEALPNLYHFSRHGEAALRPLRLRLPHLQRGLPRPARSSGVQVVLGLSSHSSNFRLVLFLVKAGPGERCWR